MVGLCCLRAGPATDPSSRRAGRLHDKTASRNGGILSSVSGFIASHSIVKGGSVDLRSRRSSIENSRCTYGPVGWGRPRWESITKAIAVYFGIATIGNRFASSVTIAKQRQGRTIAGGGLSISWGRAGGP